MPTPPPIVLSFDVEEHYRIEAAHRLPVPTAETAAEHARRMEATTRQLLARLADHAARATFFVVGEIAESHPQLVRDIAAAGHEIGSHSHRHQRIHRLAPAEFRRDAEASKKALEDAAGVPVTGYRAPTFSVTAATAWAIDELIAAGYHYDSSVFPVRHDRYGVPAAPRGPFWAESAGGGLLELPPATLRVRGVNLPVAGGGYFRLFPLRVMLLGIDRLAHAGLPAVLYFHPWEFDPDHPRLPLPRASAARTYVGARRTNGRLEALLTRYAGRFRTASEVAAETRTQDLPRFSIDSARSLKTWG